MVPGYVCTCYYDQRLFIGILSPFHLFTISSSPVFSVTVTMIVLTNNTRILKPTQYTHDHPLLTSINREVQTIGSAYPSWQDDDTMFWCCIAIMLLLLKETHVLIIL